MALVQVNFISKSLSRTVTFNAVIPTDSLPIPGEPAPEKKPFKTLYLLHGIFGNYTDWISGTSIQSLAQRKNLAVIMPSGDNSFYVDHEASGDMYGEFIGRELVDQTRELFHLSCRREDTFIGGLSMGGYGALRNGLKYHDTFGCIIALSSALILRDAMVSTHDAPVNFAKRGYYESVFGDLTKLMGSDKDPEALIAILKRQNADIPKIYLACGSEDFLIRQNRDYRDFLQAQGVEFTYEEGPGIHDWIFWDKYIEKAINWLPLDY
ncbi:MAG: alpha/beta hydrolase family protein [Clostridiales bacterium]|jgi:S-formylglutathione hydrolase FrmB|nr:esterase family protein [Eubacteriales bacterium]MDH7566347.1 alpha/beta hydrolase family protein [Clostridiales bacterium]